MALVVIFFVLLAGLVSAAVLGLVSVVRAVRDTGHRRRVIRPVTAATMNLLRSRDVRVDIPRDIVGSSVPRPDAGTIHLPVDWTGAEGDRDNLTDMLSERLKAPVSLSFDMSGRTPTVSLSVPKQPPARVTWDMAVSLADTVRPYLGESASGPVHWDLGDDSPHMAVVGGGGSGKSELVAWAVAQFMRGGAGVVVLDPKYASHRWLMHRSNVLYAADPETLHEVILWLTKELATRGRASQLREQEFPRIVVLAEERNSMQDLLRAHWRTIKAPGDPIQSPAITGLDMLSSQGRSLNINIVLAAQAVAQADIGRRNNYGAFSVAGRMPANAWKLAGAARKPGIAGTPGRFGYLVAGVVTVFQAAFPDARYEPERLWEWASGGVDALDTVLLYQRGTGTLYRSEAGTTAPVEQEEPTEELATLADFAGQVGLRVETLRARLKRDPGAPVAVGKGVKNASLYRLTELERWHFINLPAGAQE